MKTIRIGILGTGRGRSFFESILMNNGEVVAICDYNSVTLEKAVKKAAEVMPEEPAQYTDFEEFIKHPGMDAVFLANFFHEHAPFAIKCLEKGLHVLSECTSNGTMAEGVALVRAAEKSKAFYMLAENYPFMQFNQEMRKVYRTGILGRLLFGEGEYNHPFDYDNQEEHRSLRPYPRHWRNYNPRTYYITHSLAPLMYTTGAFPKRVTAMPVFAPLDEYEHVGSCVGDRAAIITTLNDDDSVYRVTGCAAFGAHENSYRICCTNAQMENLRTSEKKVAIRFNKWQVPEGMERESIYVPQWPEAQRELIEKTGHGGGDFFVIKEFFDCIRENRRPEMDEYFATTCASVAILGHRSLLEHGVPYDIPDFRNEDERVKYENDRETPFWGSDGSEPTIPCCSRPDYKPSDEQYAKYLEMVNKK